MKFVKDLLLLELETAGPDIERDHILEVAALVLDRDNLLEKAHGHWYVKHSMLESTLWDHARKIGVDISVLQNASKPLEFLRQFNERFPKDYTLLVQSPLKVMFLRQAYRKHAMEFPFDLRLLDAWTLEYLLTIRKGLKKMPSLQTMADQYKLPTKNTHSAYERVKLEAEIFRRMCKEL
jgi:DNA polymerase III alpha subunit (gram-positive type)